MLEVWGLGWPCSGEERQEQSLSGLCSVLNSCFSNTACEKLTFFEEKAFLFVFAPWCSHYNYSTNYSQASCPLEHNPKAGSTLLCMAGPTKSFLCLWWDHHKPSSISLKPPIQPELFSGMEQKLCLIHACLPRGTAAPSWMWHSQEYKLIQPSPSTWPTHLAGICMASTEVLPRSQRYFIWDLWVFLPAHWQCIPDLYSPKLVTTQNCPVDVPRANTHRRPY